MSTAPSFAKSLAPWCHQHITVIHLLLPAVELVQRFYRRRRQLLLSQPVRMKMCVDWIDSTAALLFILFQVAEAFFANLLLGNKRT
jgi:hypothetical protein